MICSSNTLRYLPKMLSLSLLVAPLANATIGMVHDTFNVAKTAQWSPGEIIRLHPAVSVQLWRRPDLAQQSSWLFQIERSYASRNVAALRCQPSCDITELAHPALIMATNGGFFTQASATQTTVVSALVSEQQFIAHNIGSVTRQHRAVPVERAFFALSSAPAGQFTTGWTTSWQPNEQQIRYSQCQPAAAMEMQSERLMAEHANKDRDCVTQLAINTIQFAVGGGPMLLHRGQKIDSFAAEQMPGSGVEWSTERPRTAIAHSKTKLMLLITPQASLAELQDMLKSAGAEAAINLDGGSSSVLTIGEQVKLAQGRQLPAFLLVYRQP